MRISSSTLLRNIAKLVFFVYILPLLLTFWHVKYRLSHRNLLLVTTTNSLLSSALLGPTTVSINDNFSGIYAPWGNKYVKATKTHRRGYFSIPSGADIRSISEQDFWLGPQPLSLTTLQPNKDQWCLSDNHQGQSSVCSSTLLGDYRDLSTNRTSLRVELLLMDSSSSISASSQSTWTSWFSVSSNQKFRTNPERLSTQQNKQIQEVLQYPATYFWIALNCILAFVYWNKRVSVHSVAKLYDSMVNSPFEIWRSFTGATAHFEIWHLLFNMMALYSLGMELENNQSIRFFLDNLTLIPTTTAIWMGLEYLYQRHRNAVSSNPTVGYSGVLFAWMVVASLEQPQTCPIHFLPSLCFTTYTWHNIKFSLGPIVQLVVAQVLLPRVSLTGHLAGIIAGLLLHWGMLPFFTPSIWVPSLYLLYLWRFRKIIQVGAYSGPKRIFQVMSLVFALSVVTFGVVSALTISFGLVCVYWYCTHQSSETQLVVLRGFVLSAVLTLVSDAMSIGSWLVLRLWLKPLTVTVLVCRCFVLFISIVLASQGLVESEGIFYYAFQWTILEPSQQILQSWNVQAGDNGNGRDHTFQGRGHRLGGRRNADVEMGTTGQVSRLL